jgi:hypothetical protein
MQARDSGCAVGQPGGDLRWQRLDAEDDSWGPHVNTVCPCWADWWLEFGSVRRVQPSAGMTLTLLFFFFLFYFEFLPKYSNSSI